MNYEFRIFLTPVISSNISKLYWSMYKQAIKYTSTTLIHVPFGWTCVYKGPAEYQNRLIVHTTKRLCLFVFFFLSENQTAFIKAVNSISHFWSHLWSLSGTGMYRQKFGSVLGV
jgi:hypothetical protein